MPCHDVSVVVQFFSVTDEFADEGHEERGADDNHPVSDADGHYIEELSTTVDDEYLANEDDRCDEHKSFAL